MPKVTSELAPPGEEVLKLGENYLIDSVTEFETDKKLKGYRLKLSSSTIPVIAIPLWPGQTGMVNQQSKLGTFLRAFGNNTDDWIGKKFKIVSWSLKNRLIVEVQ